MFANSRTRLDSAITNLPPGLNPAPDDLNANIGAIGLHRQRDTRDSQFYPTCGSLLDMLANLFDGRDSGAFDG